MANLRKEVKALEEEELFESVSLKNPGPAFAQEPTSSDVDVIMRSMLPLSLSSTTNPNHSGPTPRINGDSSNATVMGRPFGGPGMGL